MRSRAWRRRPTATTAAKASRIRRGRGRSSRTRTTRRCVGCSCSRAPQTRCRSGRTEALKQRARLAARAALPRPPVHLEGTDARWSRLARALRKRTCPSRLARPASARAVRGIPAGIRSKRTPHNRPFEHAQDRSGIPTSLRAGHSADQKNEAVKITSSPGGQTKESGEAAGEEIAVMSSGQAQPDYGKQSVAVTGVVGLDRVLAGGFVRNRVYLVEGMPGSGKTTLAMQYLIEGARQGEPVLYVTLAETQEELAAVAASHGWSLEGVAIYQSVPSEDTLRPE